jgi:hypothetical protein
LDSRKCMPVPCLEAERRIDAHFLRIFGNFEGNEGANRSLTVNRIAGLEKIKQTVFFDFCRVG